MPPLTGRRGAQRGPHPDRGDDGFVRWQAKQRGFGGEVRRARHRGDFSASDGADLWRHRAWTRPFFRSEAMMGLFDGKPSSADLAARFGVPVIVVISAQAMAQTFGAIALGLAHF